MSRSHAAPAEDIPQNHLNLLFCCRYIRETEGPAQVSNDRMREGTGGEEKICLFKGKEKDETQTRMKRKNFFATGYVNVYSVHVHHEPPVCPSAPSP